MRHPRCRESAESNAFLKVPSHATIAWFFLFCHLGASRAGFACLSNPCVYGICIDDVNDTFSCYCIDGYTGFLCQTNWDECWSNPCLNGGICVDGIAQFNCTCPQGFQGELCEQNVDECQSNPCHNNGTCIDGPNGYTCACLSGYLGNFCETDVSVCNDTREARCLNGGLCVEGPGFTFNCACPLGWSGEFCEESVDECVSSPCCNGGVCIDLQANYTCACPFGFSGRNCEVELEMCGDVSPCQNGALCLVEDTLSVCYCVPDFHGDRCQFQYNECLLGPGCRNGGTCIDGVDGYNCSCPPGWTGSFCECHILGEDELDCNYFSPSQTALPQTTMPTVPIATVAGVPNTSLYERPSTKNILSTKITTPKYYYSTLKDCIPVWVIFATKPSVTEMDVSVPTKKTSLPDWFTTKGISTAGTKYVKTDESEASIPTTTKSTTESLSNKTEILLTTLKTHKNTTATTRVTATTTKILPTFTVTTTPSVPASTESVTHVTAITTTTPVTPKATETTPVALTLITENIYTSATMSTDATQESLTTTTTTTTTATTTTTTTAIPTTTTTAIPTTTTTAIPTTTTAIPTTTTAIPTTTTTPIPTTTTAIPTTTTAIPTTTTTPIPTTTIAVPTTTTAIPTTTTTTTTAIPTTTTAIPATITAIITTTIKAEQSTTKTTPGTSTIPADSEPTIAKVYPITTATTLQVLSNVTSKLMTTTPGWPTTKFSIPMTLSTKAKERETVPTIETVPSKASSFTGATQTRWVSTTQATLNCRAIPCENGGICSDTPAGPKCLCRSNWEGPFCGGKANIQVAGLSGSSYVTHKLTNTHNMRIDVTARTVSPTGLILYSHLGLHIFMTLYMEDGLLKFKFSCGLQTMILSEVQFHVNNGYDLVATVTLEFFPPTKNPVHCLATVRVNNTLAMSGEQVARGPHADSGYARVYIGGVPSRYAYKEEVPISKGFIGCMQGLQINGNARGIFKDSADSDGITECKSLACLSSPCRSGSTCVESNNTWACLCPSGFLGLTCERSVCLNNPCEYGGTCVPFPGSGFVCLCPSGKQGLFCENEVETGYPLFASSAHGLSTFAAYKLPTGIYQDMTLTFKFLPHDREQISLMVFIGQAGHHGATSDHLAVSFIKGYVVLTWNLGSGPRRIFTKRPVAASAGQSFHTVQIGKVGQRAWLAVDNQQNVTGKSPGKLIQLNTRSVMYLGGHDSRNFSLLPHDLPLHTGFSGCLFDVELRTGQMLVKVEKARPAFSRGVGQCGRSLCRENSCENGGGCVHHGASFACLCGEGWFGPTCSLKHNPCDAAHHNCSSGSTCVPLRQGFYCDCPVGKTGRYCEISEELSDVKLKGIRSYMALAVEGLHTLQSCIDLEIRPLSLHGLVLYSGKPEGNRFWSLSLQDGVLELRISPGVNKRRGDVLVVKSKRALDTGKWHRVRVGRYGRRLYLWVDGSTTTGNLLPGENLMTSGPIMYIGGVPDLSSIPQEATGKILTSFFGCVRKLIGQWTVIPLIKGNILEGRNLEDCDGSACGGDVCENGGTCHVNKNNQAFCTCLKHYRGRRCEYPLSCKKINCQNGGRCEQDSTVPQCHCPNGWGGPFCETGYVVKVPQFGGKSYIVVDGRDSANVKRRDIIKNVDVKFVHLSFTTTKSNGMLLWTSEEEAEFLGIGIENKRIKTVWSWNGCNTTSVALGKDVADGGWHDLSLTFNSENVTISLDKEAIYSKSKGNCKGDFPKMNGRFYLGGFPEIQLLFNRTHGHFFSGFDGCLQRVAWQAVSEISDFSKFTGENIKPCNTFEN